MHHLTPCFILAIVWLVGLCSCSSTPPALETKDHQAVPLDGHGAAMSKQKEAINQRWAKYEISTAHLPPLEKTTHFPSQEETTLYRSGSMQLGLSLGKRTPTANGRLRSGSRYRLTSEDHQIRIEAESVLADSDITSDGHPKVVILKDTASETFFIAEWQCWTTWRYILLSSSPSFSGNLHQQTSHSMVYFDRLGIEEDPAEDLPSFLGIHAGYLYLKLDDRIYAIPLETLKTTTSLEYTIG